MIIEQRLWKPDTQWSVTRSDGDLTGHDAAQLVLAFGSTRQIGNPDRFDELRAFYPDAHIVSCSTAGEILGESFHEDSIVATAIRFRATRLLASSLSIAECKGSYAAGRELAGRMEQEGLAHLLVISDGQQINGSELVRGLEAGVGPQVTITGGLAGDGMHFMQTLAGLNVPASEGNVVVVAFYGDALNIGFGSVGGWDTFGADRVITRSEGNVLYELDGHSALELYKLYLGSLAEELPGSALLFPLSIRECESDTSVVRTILSIDEENQSMTFAGDMPQGAYAKLMKANVNRLIEGASQAGSESLSRIGGGTPELAILISCVGRRVVLGELTEEEVEAIRTIMGEDTAITGFYSYGEISPTVEAGRCELHNQTMTVTTLSERVHA
ncbi:MAG TPA: FIST N-terminal domain-containing protein [Candidatus Kapabacteria bacterium]|nr:FIST N-terminal domain-containing protein [Candidatus Kapabacteria bacterium]